jgi:hypothetical protein
MYPLDNRIETSLYIKPRPCDIMQMTVLLMPQILATARRAMDTGSKHRIAEAAHASTGGGQR